MAGPEPFEVRDETLREVRALLRRWLGETLRKEDLAWLDAESRAAVDGPARRYYMAFSAASRHAGKTVLELPRAERAAAERVRPGWAPGAWSREQAARTFVSWMMQPGQDVVWDVEAGSLPLSRRAQDMPAWQRKAADTEGLAVFTKALETARVRPVHPAYPQVSKAVGEAVVAVLLGRSTPAKALRACADSANAALAVPR